MNANRVKRLLRAGLLVLITLSLAVSACGIERDSEPQILARDQLPDGLRPGQIPTPPPEVPNDGVTSADQVFMVGPDGRLVGVERRVTDDPFDLLQTLLLETTPEELAAGITTTLSRDADVLSVEVDDLFLLATVDLAPGSLVGRSSDQKLGFAQIVFTLTSLETIDTVEFVQSNPQAPGEPPTSISVQTDTGTTLPGQRVGREAFALLDPSVTQIPNFEPDIPTPVPTATPIPDDGEPRFDLPIWKLNQFNELVQVSRFVVRDQEALLISLFDGTLAGERDEDQLRSAIPPDALLNGVELRRVQVPVAPDPASEDDATDQPATVETNITVVDLAPGSLPPADEGGERVLATAQIVFTLTELVEVDQVALAVDGVTIPMDTPAGITLPFGPNNPVGLSRADFASLPGIAEAPPSEPPPPTPTPG